MGLDGDPMVNPVHQSESARSMGGINVAYLFPGQGSQYVGMGKDFYDKHAAARAVYDKAASLLDFDVRAVCFEGPAEKLSQTRYSQPAIFVTSMAVMAALKEHPKAKLWTPVYAAGLSLGEATALCATGSISFEDGVRFVRARGKFMDEAAVERPGMMAAVLGLDLKATEEICARTGAEVGNLNAPGQIIISGRKERVELAMEELRAGGARRVIPLDVSGGFHSSCMEPACRRIEAALKDVKISKPTISVVSNLTANIEVDSAQIHQNLIWQMNHRTLWEDSMRFIIGKGVRTFVEFAPGKVLKGLMKKIDPAVEVISLAETGDFDAIL
jgi:[acyl-carrier-protein] S-malonyltransferase